MTVAVETISTEDHRTSFRNLISSQDIEEIEHDMKIKENDHPMTWGVYDESMDRAHIKASETEYLIPGTLSLIDRVVSASDSGEPYDSVIFLDKSARPAAYLYTVLVNELKKKNLIEDSVELPSIKYMDIGKTDDPIKFENAKAGELMREKLTPEMIADDPNNARVLIVDEFEDTGKTLREAEKVFRETYYIDPEVTYQFDSFRQAPFWYRATNSKLVRDARIVEGVKNAVTSISDDAEELAEVRAMEAIKSTTGKFPREVFVNVYNTFLDNWFEESPEDIDRDEIRNILEGALQEYFESRGYLQNIPIEINEDDIDSLEIIEASQLKLLPRSLWDYYRSASGRFSLPVRSDRDTETARHIRSMLKDLAKMTADRIEENSQNV